MYAFLGTRAVGQRFMTEVDSTDPQFRLLARRPSTHDYTIVIARFVTLLNKLVIFILLARLLIPYSTY